MLDYLMVQKGYTYTMLKGSLDLEERTKRVDMFNNDPNMFVFLISTRAGGVGLNIVSANKV
jgi:DNA excision repair protein ERCC-6-like 2